MSPPDWQAMDVALRIHLATGTLFGSRRLVMPSHDPDYDELRAKYTSLQNSAKTPGLHALLNSHLTISTEDTIDALFRCLTAAYHDLRATTIRQQQPDP